MTAFGALGNLAFNRVLVLMLGYPNSHMPAHAYTPLQCCQMETDFNVVSTACSDLKTGRGNLGSIPRSDSFILICYPKILTEASISTDFLTKNGKNAPSQRPFDHFLRVNSKSSVSTALLGGLTQ